MKSAAIDEILQAVAVLREPGSVIELRILNGSAVWSGYYNDADRLAADAARMSGKVKGIYITPNPVLPDLLARRSNRLVRLDKRDSSTSDSEILRRRWLFVDLDPVRPKGISATDVEHELAIERARTVREYLRQLSWPDPILADSGNGAHLLYRIDLPNDDAARELVSRCLQALALRFSDEKVDVDTSVFNASRIWKLYGTIAAKGDSTLERPHRLARILETPNDIVPVPHSLLAALAAELPAGEPEPGRGPGSCDVDEWLARYGIEVWSRGPWNDGRKWVLRVCPFNSEHTDRSAVLLRSKNGAVSFRCLHNSCAGKGWHDVRDLCEPGWREAPEWETPLPFHSVDLPDFPVQALPEPLESFVRAEAIATQTPLALAGGIVLTVCAIGLSKKVRVRMKPDWEEPVNLYTVTILPSGELKTPVVGVAVRPVEAYEARERKRLAPLVKETIARRKILELAIKRAQQKAAKADPQDRGDLEQEVLKLVRQLDQIPVPVRPRLLADDVTPEKLANLLSLHGGRIAIVSAEGGIFDLLAGRYSKNAAPNFEIFLKGYSGETLRIDRITREEEFIQDPALCVALAVQPEVIHGMAATPGFRGRGLIARFHYAWPNSLLGGRDPDAPPLPEGLRREYDRIVTALLELPFESDENGEPFARVLTMTDEAYGELLRIRAWLEGRQGPAGDLAWMSDWVGKLSGAIARIAAVLHMVAYIAAGTPWRQPISGETMLRAIIIGEFYLEHARRTLGQMGADPAIGMAQHIIAWVRRSNSLTFSKRDAFNALQGRVQKASELDPALRLLVEHSYLREVIQERKPRGRPKGPNYETNPAVLSSADFADFAYRERKSVFEEPSSPATGAESISDSLGQNLQNLQNPDVEPEAGNDDAAA